MRKQVRSIAIWQTTKTLTALYFIVFAIIYVILTIVELAMGTGAEALVNLVVPFIASLAILILYAISFWIYNWVAKWTGGVEVNLEDPKE